MYKNRLQVVVIVPVYDVAIAFIGSLNMHSHLLYVHARMYVSIHLLHLSPAIVGSIVVVEAVVAAAVVVEAVVVVEAIVGDLMLWRQLFWQQL
jgi:hypothetical protein